jgi:hypothetical protein
MRYRKVDLAAIDVVRDRWLQLVPEPLASRCEPLAVQDRTLVVAVPNGAYAERLALEAAQILEGFADMGEHAPKAVRAQVRGSK